MSKKPKKRRIKRACPESLARDLGFWVREWFKGERFQFEGGQYLRHDRWEQCEPAAIGAEEDLNRIEAVRHGLEVVWWKHV